MTADPHRLPVLSRRRLDGAAWSALDGQIDKVLTSVRENSPDPVTEIRSFKTLLSSLT
jgi:hypothetical protein